MNLKQFFRHYKVTYDGGNTPIPASLKKRVDDEFLFCMEQLGGKSFNQGVYRVYRWDQVESQTEQLGQLFAAARGHVVVFAADWCGRQFAIDFAEPAAGKPSVECFDLGAPDSFCTDQPIVTFHNDALVEKADAALALSLFKKWRRRHKEDIAPDQCVGYKVPLFLGGADELDNLELVDMEVYHELCVQLYNKVRDLPEGTPIGEISIKDTEDE